MRDLISQISAELIRRAVKISAVVGSILNLINQGDVLWGGAELSIMHFLLNYLVPFGVSSFSAMQTGVRTQPLANHLRTLGALPAANAKCREDRNTD